MKSVLIFVLCTQLSGCFIFFPIPKFKTTPPPVEKSQLNTPRMAE